MIEDFLKELEDIKENLRTDNFNEKLLIDQIIFSEAKLPLDKEYMVLNRVYSSYVNTSVKYLSQQNRSQDEKLKDITTLMLKAFKNSNKNKRKEQINQLQKKLLKLYIYADNRNCHRVRRFTEDNTLSKIARDSEYSVSNINTKNI